MSVLAAPWQNRAACRGRDPAMFETPHKAGRRDPDVAIDQARRALAICRTCPVRYPCDLDAQDDRDNRLGMIRGGRAYNQTGTECHPCQICGQYVLSGDQRGTYCESHNSYGRWVIERDRQIRAAAAGGMTCVAIGVQFQLSPSRVSKILQER